jgi:hypothetical protein
MSLDQLEGWRGRRMTRRSLLQWGTRGSLGAAALVLVGCGDDDDDDDNVTATATASTTTTAATATATATSTTTAIATTTEEPSNGGGIAGGGPIIEQVTLDGGAATLVVFNSGDAAVSLDGWFLCNRPLYWPMPAVELAPGDRLTVHAGSGTDAAGEVFAGGGIGSLDGGDGEIALYSSNAFGDASAIVSYVGWGSGGGRIDVARSAGIWGDATLEAGDGATIAFGGGDPGAEAYSVQ